MLMNRVNIFPVCVEEEVGHFQYLLFLQLRIIIWSHSVVVKKN